jgi:16S rRNA U516 pseudouridylate synthase RsuA-like enzyme
MHPRYKLPKEYVVLTPQKPTEAAMRRVSAGIEIEGRLVVPHEFRIMREAREGVLLTIVVHEGLNRVIRRMMDAAGISVTGLQRVRVGPLSLSGIPRGAHRDLTPGELASLLQALHIDRQECLASSAAPDLRQGGKRGASRRRSAKADSSKASRSSGNLRRERTAS